MNITTRFSDFFSKSVRKKVVLSTAISLSLLVIGISKNNNTVFAEQSVLCMGSSGGIIAETSNKDFYEELSSIDSIKLLDEKQCKNSVVSFVPETNETPVNNIEEEEKYYISDIPLDKSLQKYTYDLCKEREISYELVLAMMYYESKFDTEALSYNNNGSFDSGIMQINSCNIETLANNYGITDLQNPYDNIYAGVNMVSEKITDLGENDGLMAYNMGLGGYYSAIKNGIYQTKYSSEVLEKKTEYENLLHSI